MFPALPLLTACAAVGLQRTTRRCLRGCCFWRLLLPVVLGLLAAGAAATALSMQISRWNYPGGEAMASLHDWAGARGYGTGDARPVRVHVGVLAAMTGASRFTQLPDPSWVYSKVGWGSVEEGGSGLAVLPWRHAITRRRATLAPCRSPVRCRGSRAAPMRSNDLATPPRCRRRM